MPRLPRQGQSRINPKYPPTTVAPQPVHTDDDLPTDPPEEEDDVELESLPQYQGGVGDDDPQRRSAHNQYKISQDNHAMATRRVRYGDDVDAGFYGMVNPEPENHVSYDTDETRLMNLREARYHAQKCVHESVGPAMHARG